MEEHHVGQGCPGRAHHDPAVIKSLILGPERSLLRKTREAILSFRLEGSLTKKEILNLYLNNVYMGHGVYGIEAASQIYFGKHAWEITRAEAALLAGIVQAPSRYTPKKYPGSARVRQEYVIEQMAEKKFIDERRKKEMLKEKINVRENNGVFTDSYFKDYVLKYVEEKIGKGIIGTRKLSIYTTVDAGLQKLAEDSVKRGLNLYEQRKGAYSIVTHLEKKKWNDYKKARDRDYKQIGFKAGRQYNLLVSEQLNNGYAVFAGNEKGFLKIDTLPYKPGDVVKATYDGVDSEKIHTFHPIKTIKVEGALICMDVQTGHILAMVGGRDFEQSPYNRAVSAKIQSGSAFKPFIYCAALRKGYSIDAMLVDEPKEYSVGMGKTWTPRNYDGKYLGQVSMRDAVAYSKNAATVRLLEEVGIHAVKDVLMDLGIDAALPHELAIALGRSNLTLLALVKGYSAVANGGYRVKPIAVLRIVDSSGNVLEENYEDKVRVLSEDVAYKMNVLLKGPTEYGTAKGASKLGYPVAGKTGTTSNYYDALFIGYSPHVITGVWVGFDTRTSLGEKESGARVCLPIWMSFMGTALRRYPPDDFASPSVFSPLLEWFRGIRSDGGSSSRSDQKSEPMPNRRQEPTPEPWPRIP